MTEKTYDADGAAAYLKVHRNTVLKRARSGELRGGKIGRRWVFVKEDLEEYLDRAITAQVEQRRAAQPEISSVTVVSKPQRAPRSLPDLPPIPD